MGAIKQKIVSVSPETEGNPVYEIIKKEDVEGAFRDALVPALNQILSRIDSLIETMTSTMPQGLWTWSFTSRWDWDLWF